MSFSVRNVGARSKRTSLRAEDRHVCHHDDTALPILAEGRAIETMDGSCPLPEVRVRTAFFIELIIVTYARIAPAAA